MPGSCTPLLPICKYGIRNTLKTTWTKKNPSRRFASCRGEEAKFVSFIELMNIDDMVKLSLFYGGVMVEGVVSLNG